MKAIMILLALVLGAAAAQAQLWTSTKYYVPVVLNATDTIPGTQSGGGGAGTAGWIRVDDNYVNYSIRSLDSAHYRVIVDYTDSAWASSTGSSAKTTPFNSVTGFFHRSKGLSTTSSFVADSVLIAFSHTGTDSVAYFPNEASPFYLIQRTLRDASINLIPGAKWIRFRIFVPNVADKISSTTAQNVLRLTVNQASTR